MTTRERIIKNLLFFVVVVYYVGVYFGINLWTAQRGHYHYLALPFEDRIPLFPAFIFGYLLLFFLISFLYLVVDDLLFFKKVVKAFLICCTIHFIFFILFPVEYNLRPLVDGRTSWAYLLVEFYYVIDPPYNNFPSMHVSNSFLVAFILNHYRKGWGWVFQPLALLVAVSVVLVRQHYIVDAFAGALVGWGVYRYVFCEGFFQRA